MSTISPETFAERLHLARSSKGLSQAALAEMLGTSQQQLSSYELGFVMPRTRMLLNLATCLGVSRQWLVDGLGPAQEVLAEPGFQPPKVITKILAEGQTAITFVLSTDLRKSLAARAQSDGVSLDELLVGALLDLAESHGVDSKP